MAAEASSFFSSAYGSADHDRGTHGKTYDHHGQHMHNLTANRHGSGAVNAVELPNDEQIRHPIECLQKV